jgi:DUF4097 and DUF4098 domain-containing protein YvlB
VRRNLTALAAALVAALALPALAAQEEFHWAGKVAQGDAVEVKGINGGITATGSSAGQVEVTAVKRGRKSDPASVKVEIVEHAGGVTICAVYPSVDGRENTCAPGSGGRLSAKDNDVNVEFQVKVPAGVRFVGRTVNGGISASGLTADAEATTVNGGVEIEAGGTARATTVNGGISARLGRADWDGLLKLTTVNGGIDVAVPSGLNTEVKASTVNGDIQTDFPVTMTGRISKRHIQGTIGSGGRQLEMATVNGSIELKKAAR